MQRFGDGSLRRVGQRWARGQRAEVEQDAGSCVPIQGFLLKESQQCGDCFVSRVGYLHHSQPDVILPAVRVAVLCRES